jgi:hypothetical protein
VADGLGRSAEAEQHYRTAVAGARRSLGDGHDRTLSYVTMLAIFLRTNGRAAEAEPLAREAVTGLPLKLAPTHSTIAMARGALGGALLDLGRPSEAEPELLETARVLDSAKGAAKMSRAQCIRDLVSLYEARDRDEPGKGYGAKAAEWRAKLDADGKPAGGP